MKTLTIIALVIFGLALVGLLGLLFAVPFVGGAALVKPFVIALVVCLVSGFAFGAVAA